MHTNGADEMTEEHTPSIAASFARWASYQAAGGATSTPKTGAQRQAAHKARQQAAGLVRVAVWVYPSEVEAIPKLIAWLRATTRQNRKVGMSENG